MKRTRKLLSLLTTATLIGSLCASPFAEQTAQAATGKVTKVSVSNLPTKNLTLKKKKKFKLKVKVKTSGKASKAVSYKSSNKKIVSVTSKGKLTAKKNGKAKITITSKANKKKKVTIKVTVGTPVSSIKLADTKVSMKIKEKKSLTATVLPANASNKAIVWKSSNPKVATVSNGTVTALAAGTTTITALAGDGSGKKATATITVTTSVAVPISSIKLNATEKKLDLGKTFKLAATISPSNASKKELKWTSSNSTIASVDQAGNVKALKGGTATITAQATDGSGKSASCKITVLNPVTVTSLSYMGSRVIHFTLSEPTKLKRSDFTVNTKIHHDGQYNREYIVDDILSPDNKDYYILLDNSFELGNYVQVEIKGLRGNPNTTVEMQIKKTNNISTTNSEHHYQIGSSVYDYIYLYGCGYSTFTISGLPEGLNYTPYTKDNITYLYITGKPSKAGSYPVVVKYKDEFNNAYEEHRTYTIYDENSVQAYISSPFKTHNGLLYINILGKWNDSTTLSIVGKDYGLSVNKSTSEHSFYLDGDFSETKPGKYPITVHIETTEDDTIYSCDYTTTIEVENEIAIKGTIKNLSGDPILAQVYYVKLQGDGYTASGNSFFTSQNGEYTFYAPAGEYYIMISDPLAKIYSSTNYKIDKSRTESFTAPLYSVDVKAPNDEYDDVPSFWQSEEGYVTYLNHTSDRHYLIVQPGQHTYTAYDTNNSNRFSSTQYTVTGNFNASTKSVKLTKKENAQIIGKPMTLDKPQCDLLFSIGNTLHAFTPSESGTYYFYSDAARNLDPDGYVYDKDGNELDYKYSWRQKNFVIEVELEKGKTYYLGASYYSETSLLFNSIFYQWESIDHTSETFKIPLIISKKRPTDN